MGKPHNQLLYSPNFFVGYQYKLLPHPTLFYYDLFWWNVHKKYHLEMDPKTITYVPKNTRYHQSLTHLRLARQNHLSQKSNYPDLNVNCFDYCRYIPLENSISFDCLGNDPIFHLLRKSALMRLSHDL